MRTVLFLSMFVAAHGVAAAQPDDSSSWATPALVSLQEQLHQFDRRVYEGLPFTLRQALDEALASNPDLIALRKAFEAARHRPSQERFLAAPTFETQIWQWPIDSLTPANVSMYMFMVNQDLPGRGKRALRVAVAEKETALAENEIAVRARHTIDEVKRAYAELFLARKAIDISLANVDLLRQLADISAARYATGRISQQDVLKAIVEVSKLHDDLVMLDERAQITEARLNTALGRAPNAVIGPLAEPHERLLLPAAEELQRVALEQQPELRASRLEVERAQVSLALVSREYKPDFSVMAGYMLMPDNRDAWMAKAAITWPTAPWARGKLDAQKAEATAEIDAARARQRAMESRIRFAVQEAYVRFKTAEQRAALLRTSILPQSEQTLEVSRAAYQTGQVDFLALVDNQRVLLAVQLNYYRALSDREQALADLERAVGTEIAPATLAVANGAGKKQNR